MFKQSFTLICTLLTALFISLILFTWTSNDLFHFKSMMGEPKYNQYYNKEFIHQQRRFVVGQNPVVLGRTDLLARKADTHHLSIAFNTATEQYALTNISNAKKVLTKNNGVTRYIREWALTAGDQFLFGKEQIQIIKVTQNQLQLKVGETAFQIDAKTFDVKILELSNQIVFPTPWKQHNGSQKTNLTPLQCQGLKEKIKHYALYSIFQTEPHFRIGLGGQYHCENNIPLAGIDYQAYMIEYRDQHFFLRPFHRSAAKKGNVFKIIKNGKHLSIDDQPLFFKDSEQILITLGFSSYLLRFNKNNRGQPFVTFKTLNKGDIKQSEVNQNHQKIVDRTIREDKHLLFNNGLFGLTTGFILCALLWFFSSSFLNRIGLIKLFAGFILVMLIMVQVKTNKISLLAFQTSDIAMMLWVNMLFSLAYLWFKQQKSILNFYLSTLVLMGYGILYSWHLQDLAESTKYYNDFKEQLFLILLGMQLWYFVLCYQQIILKQLTPLLTRSDFSLDDIQPYLKGIGLLFLVWLWIGKTATLLIVCSILFLKASALKAESLSTFILQLIWQTLWLGIFIYYGLNSSLIISLAIIIGYILLITFISRSRKLRNKIKSGQKHPKQGFKKINKIFNRLLLKNSIKNLVWLMAVLSFLASIALVLINSPVYILAFNCILTALIILLLSYSHNRERLPFILILLLSFSFILVYAGAGSETGIQGIQPMEFMKLLFCIILSITLFLFSFYRFDGKSYFLPLFTFICLGGTLVATSLLTSDQSFLVLMAWSFVLATGFILIVSYADKITRFTRLILFILMIPFAFYLIVPNIINVFNNVIHSATGIARYAAWQAPEKYPYSGSQYQYASCIYLVHYKEKMDKCYIGPNEMLPSEIKIPHLSNVDDDFALTGFITATNIVRDIPFYIGLALFIGFQVLWFITLISTLKPFIKKSIIDWQVKIYGIFLFAGLGFVQAHILIAWGSNTGFLPVMGQPMTFLGRQGSHLVLFIFPFLYIVSLAIGFLKEEK